MSRVRRYAHSLLSGYALLAANIAYSLGSVPLAFAYLHHSEQGKAEFGLWVLCTQLAGYLALVDFGMAGTSRILIDYKDDRNGGIYGGVIQTLALVSVVQGAIILAASALLALSLAGLVGVPAALQPEFAVLMFGQGAAVALGFCFRVFNYILAAHQRQDVINLWSTASFAAGFGALWAGFHQGWGVYSMLAGQGVALLAATLPCAVVTWRLGLLPSAGAWGRPTWERFRELFAYGRDLFLFMLGSQLVNASQAVLVSRLLGLDAAAVWSVCTRASQLLAQVIQRIFDFSCPALAEMIVRREQARLFERFRAIVMVSGALATVGAAGLAAGNAAFVEVWLRGRIAWPPVNDVLLGLLMIATVYSRAHVGLVGQTKDFSVLRYLYFGQGAVFVAAAWMLLPLGGITAMLGASIAAELIFSLPYGIHRTRQYFGKSLREIEWGWLTVVARCALWLFPLAAALAWLVRPLPALPRLLVISAALGLAGSACLLRHGLDASTRQTLWQRLPAPLRARLAPRRAPDNPPAPH